MLVMSKLTSVLIPRLSCLVLEKDTSAQAIEGVLILPSNTLVYIKTHYNLQHE